MKKKTRKELEWENKYWASVVKDLMEYKGIESLEEFQGKAYCDKCLNSFESMQKRPAWRILADAFVFGVAIVVFLFVIAVIIGMHKLGDKL